MRPTSDLVVFSCERLDADEVIDLGHFIHSLETDDVTSTRRVWESLAVGNMVQLGCVKLTAIGVVAICSSFSAKSTCILLRGGCQGTIDDI